MLNDSIVYIDLELTENILSNGFILIQVDVDLSRFGKVVIHPE